MGRLITNSPKPIIKIKLAQTNYRGILALAQRVHNLMLANIGTFVTPLPTMVNFQNDIGALATAISLNGFKFNRGGSANLLACKNAAFVVFNDLTSLAAYVQQLVDGSREATYQAVVISSSGFATKSKKSKIDTMQFVRNVHQSNNKKFPVTLRRVAWRRSLGMFNGVRANAYNIYLIYGQPEVIGLWTSTTKTNVLVPSTSPLGAPGSIVNGIIVKPINPQGEGNGFRIPVKG